MEGNVTPGICFLNLEHKASQPFLSHMLLPPDMICYRSKREGKKNFWSKIHFKKVIQGKPVIFAAVTSCEKRVQ